MARKKPDESALITIDPDTGEAMNLNGPGAGSADFADASDTDAHRKTQDFYFQMLGEDESGLGYVTVHYLSHGQGQSEVSIGKFPSDKFTLDELTEEVRTKHAARLHPGKEGDYRIRLFAKGDHGRNRIVGNKLVTLLAPDAAAGTAMATIPGPAVDPVIAALLRDMRNESRELQEKMLALMESKKGRDPLDVLLALAPIITPLIGAYLARPKDDPMQALTSALALTGTIRDMRAENDAPPVQTDESAPWWAPALMHTLNGVTAAMANRGALPAPGALPSPGAVPPVPPPQGQVAHPFYNQINALVNVASQSDAEEVAGQVWNGLPAEHKAAMIPVLTAPTAFRDLALIHPGVLDCPDWWLDFIETLREFANPPHTAADSGNVDAAHNGAGQDHNAANP